VQRGILPDRTRGYSTRSRRAACARCTAAQRGHESRWSLTNPVACMKA